MRNGQLSFLLKAERPQNEALPSDFSAYRIGFLVTSSEIGVALPSCHVAWRAPIIADRWNGQSFAPSKLRLLTLWGTTAVDPARTCHGDGEPARDPRYHVATLPASNVGEAETDLGAVNSGGVLCSFKMHLSAFREKNCHSITTHHLRVLGSAGDGLPLDRLCTAGRGRQSKAAISARR